MKRKLFFILSSLFVFSASLYAQIKDRTQYTPPTVQQSFAPNVQKVVIGIDSLKSNGEINFSGAIISTGRGLVRYQWVLTAQKTGPNAPIPAIKKDSILLSGSGMDKVYQSVRKNNSGTAIRLETLAPNVIVSNVEHY